MHFLPTLSQVSISSRSGRTEMRKLPGPWGHCPKGVSHTEDWVHFTGCRSINSRLSLEIYGLLTATQLCCCYYPPSTAPHMIPIASRMHETHPRAGSFIIYLSFFEPLRPFNQQLIAERSHCCQGWMERRREGIIKFMR